MSIIVTKETILAEDMNVGFDEVTTDTRSGNQFNASYLPYSITESVTEAINNRYLSSYVEANFSALNGNALNLFNVANGVSSTNAVNYAQLALKADEVSLDAKADKSNVLELDNDTPYAPLVDYNPATKKFVDDSVFTAFQLGVSGSFTAQSGELVTVQNGLIIGIV